MATAIIVGSKFGTGVESARKIAEMITDAEIFICKKDKMPDLSRFSTVILGGSIYAGRIIGSLKSFVDKNRELIKQKNLGIFICSLESGEKAMKYIESNFGVDLEKSALSLGIFGGVMNYSKLSFVEKLLISKMIKIPDGYKTYNIEMIKVFVSDLISKS